MTPAALATRFGRTATPVWLQRSQPNYAATLTIGRRPAMPASRYALLPTLDNHAKVQTFRTLDALAAAVETARRGQALELVEVEDIEFSDVSGLHRGVQVFTLDMGNDRDRMLGFAWLNGGGREALQPALRAAARVRGAA